MWLNIKHWLLILLVAISFLGIAGCEAKQQINKPAIVEVELIGDRAKVIDGAYLFRFQRKGKDPKKPDTFNLGRNVQKLFLKDWNVQVPPELKVEKKEATVSLAEGGAYELKPSLTIAATPQTASQYFKQSITVEFPSIVGVAQFLEANVPGCPPTVGSSSDRSPNAISSPTSSPTATPTETASPSPTATPTETASPSPSTTPTETASPSPSTTPTETASPSPSTTPTETASPSPSTTPTETASPSPTTTPTETASPSPSTTPTETASPSPSTTPTETASPSLTATPTPQESVVNVTPDRTPKEENVTACVPKVEFQVTHYSSYSQLGSDNIGKNVLGIVGCALFVAFMVWFLSDKWDILFDKILYIMAAVSLFTVGLLGIPFFLFQTLKNIGWILSGFLGG